MRRTFRSEKKKKKGEEGEDTNALRDDDDISLIDFVLIPSSHKWQESRRKENCREMTRVSFSSICKMRRSNDKAHEINSVYLNSKFLGRQRESRVGRTVL